MKRWNWMLAAATGALLMSTGLSMAAPNNAPAPAATNAPRPAARFRMPILAALSRLDLTQAQKDAIKSAVQTAEQAARGIRQNTSLSPVQKQARLRGVRQNLEQTVKGILTPQQKTKLAAMLRRTRLMMGLAQALERLDLTPDQKTQVRNILQDARAKAEIIRQSNVGEQDKREQLRTLMQATRKSVMAVLTPEQRQKLEQMERQRGERA